MASVKDMVMIGKVDNIHTVVETAGQKYLCFTRLTSDAWILCATDGCDLWRLELDADELDAHRDLAEISTLDAYLAKFRSGFQSGDVLVQQTGVKANMQVGQGQTALNFELYEAKAVDKKSEFSSILFRLAERSMQLGAELEQASNCLDTLKQQKQSAVMVEDVGKGKASSNQARISAKNKMSVINPGSKKRKVAQGIQFD